MNEEMTMGRRQDRSRKRDPRVERARRGYQERVVNEKLKFKGKKEGSGNRGNGGKKTVVEEKRKETTDSLVDERR